MGLEGRINMTKRCGYNMSGKLLVKYYCHKCERYFLIEEREKGEEMGELSCPFCQELLENYSNVKMNIDGWVRRYG